MDSAGPVPRKFPARQTREASEAIARRHLLSKERTCSDALTVISVPPTVVSVKDAVDAFADPQFLSECRRSLDELTDLLKLGSIYDFQRTGV